MCRVILENTVNTYGQNGHLKPINTNKLYNIYDINRSDTMNGDIQDQNDKPQKKRKNVYLQLGVNFESFECGR